MSRGFKSGLAVCLAVVSLNCGGGGGTTTPTTPTPAASTRIINISGNLAFGDVAVGSSRELAFTIQNTGNATLTVTSLSVSGGLSTHTTTTFTSGTVAAGATQSVTIRFIPTTAGAFSGTITVNADQTSGTNTIAISGTGLSSFSGVFRGGHIIQQCNGTGSIQDLLCGAARGVFKVGSQLEFSVNLTQSGNVVTGTASLGGVVGPVIGTVTNGVLTLSGTTTGSGFTAVITAWATTVSGNTMSGSVSYNLGFQGVPGVAGIVATLSNVIKS